jgi:hypothetical protein
MLNTQSWHGMLACCNICLKVVSHWALDTKSAMFVLQREAPEGRVIDRLCRGFTGCWSAGAGFVHVSMSLL